MDSREDSASKKNSLKDSDSDKYRNYMNGPLQGTVNDHSENIISSSSQGSSLVPLSSSRTEHMNPVVNSGFNQQISKISGNNGDILRNTADTIKNQTCNKVNSNNEISENTPSFGSKISSNVNDNNTDSNQDMAVVQKYKVCLNVAGNGCSAPSTSGLNRGENVENNIFRENRKRPSSLKLKRPYSDNDSSSDTGNDDYSLGSEDGCIYTYRGGEHLADLPSSFFSLDMGLPLDKHLPIPPNYNVLQQGPNREQGSRASSPDMDFLEMDFDPGPSCEADTGDESSPDVELDAASNMPEENEPELRVASPEKVAVVAAANTSIASVSVATTSNDAYNMPSTSNSVVASRGDAAESVHSYGPYITHVNNRGEELLVRRTMSHWPVHMPVTLHVSNGDLVASRNMLSYEENAENTLAHQINQGERPPYDSVNLSSAFYHLTMAKKLIAEQTKTENEHQNVSMAGDISAEPSTSTSVGAGCVEPPRCMVWSEREACERQVTQIGTSACGATAVVNVFNALGVPVNLEKINLAVGTRQRANNAPIPRYLLSRAVAGCTAADLVTGINRASDGLVTARFFPTYPERVVSLSHWLADWISLGAVPILTLNLQIGCEGVIPDAWHHQMVFGVSSRGVYLCNPVECIRENVLWPRLTSPSVLLVRSSDVLSHGAPDADLTPLMYVPDRRFHSFNVLGQVANLLREWQTAGREECYTRTRHIRIPAAYQAGVTVSALTGSEAHRRLTLAAQLPILSPQTYLS
ncbi:hypothetical protein K1T71_010310 [Dendrolimus kikuchii]|uniref:Uncharacterized protein n=1 Tax=Dendrolimus kikuchii TaxID=765133 RepID=A0ACC1CR63_9NEOP|nr:hypothetical protein K1T71_010310 [Dendrolimus kikuchii]